MREHGRMRRVVRSAALVAVLLAGCDGEGDPSATTSPSLAEDRLCVLIRDQGLLPMAAAQGEAAFGTPEEVMAAVGQAQVLFQQEGLALIDAGREKLGRALLDFSATFSKVRFGIAEGNGEAVDAAVAQAQAILETTAIGQRCGELGPPVE
jgi:hypothetical protein